ncbi:type IV pilus modification protein PilV [Parahaliea aestuarii]|nr:type IV pilus modification protein PilV [Parahaliea aestuarii]
MRPERKGQAGASLLEVAIALLVLGVGLLGLIRLQGLAQQQLYDAAQRSLATRLARDVLARMQDNPGALAYYASLTPVAAAEAQAGPPAACALSPCLPNERAAADAAHWRRVLAGLAPVQAGPRADGGLVQGLLCIRQQGAGVAVEVAWRGSTRAVVDDGTEPRCGAGSAGMDDDLRRALRMVSYVRTP